jgi:hypothetical protein
LYEVILIPIGEAIMSRLPKLKIKLPAGNPREYICELEQAREYLNFNEGVFLVEGQGVHSYDELVHIATQDKYKNKEFLEIEWLQMIGGG